LDRYVGISVTAHVLLVLIFTVKTFLFPSEPIEYQSAVRVDLIGLPDKLPQQEEAAPIPPAQASTELPQPEIPKQATEEPQVKELPKKKPMTDPDAINLERSKMKQREALNRLKQMTALEKIQQELENDRNMKAAAKQRQLKGNVISSGSQLTGLAKLQAENYIGEVERQIRQNWSLPHWLATKNLKAQVRVRFDDKGNILSAQIVKSSGNPTFDEIVIDTVHKSAPLPPPPEKFVRLMNLEGILFGFPE
jgi:colicin import membrane protein